MKRHKNNGHRDVTIVTMRVRVYICKQRMVLSSPSQTLHQAAAGIIQLHRSFGTRPKAFVGSHSYPEERQCQIHSPCLITAAFETAID